MPSPNNLPTGIPKNLNYLGNGVYNFQLQEGYNEDCLTLTGTVLENNDSSGTTKVNIDIYYTNEGNVVGFQELELKRPHGNYELRFEFRADTYLEGE
jgi:hypothetical protein